MTTYAAPETPAGFAGAGRGAAVAAAAGRGAAGLGGSGRGGDGGGGSGLPPHGVVGFAHAVEAALVELADVAGWSMSKSEQAEALVALDRVASGVEELRLRVLVAADRNEVGTDTGAVSTAAWLAHQTRQTRARCHVSVPA